MTQVKRRPTLDDIANQVGVTKMTVSRYLRQPQSVAEVTRNKIASVIRELGYTPSRVPNILSNAKSKAIGVLLPSLSNQVFSSFVQGIEEVTKRTGYHLLLAHYGYSVEEEEAKIASLLSYHVDGLILTESHHTEHCKKMILAAGVPVVETMDLPESPIDMAVGLDHRAAAEAMVNTIIASGKRNIVYFGARMDKRTRLRMEGYQSAMVSAGLKTECCLTDEHSSFSVGRKLLEQVTKNSTVDAIFCTNDDIAVGAFIRAQSLGIKIPDDLAIAGFNALDVGKSLIPALTSVQTPRFKIGQLSATLLTDKLTGKSIDKKVFDLGFDFFNGGSI